MPTTKRREFEGGFTLMETLIGVALIAIVFSGIFGAYRLAMKMVWLDKAKTTAMAIGNGRIEMIRGLGYESVGTTGSVVLPWAKGVIDPIVSEIANGVEYTIATSVVFVSDPRDGLDGDADDSCIGITKKPRWKCPGAEDIPARLFCQPMLLPEIKYKKHFLAPISREVF